MKAARPHGFSLLEVCVASTLGVIVTLIALTTLALVMRQQQRDDDVRLGWGRLADQLRRDLRAADGFNPPTEESPDRCTVHLRDDRTVSYQLESSALVRSASGDRAQPDARETFYLPEETTWRWTQTPAERGKLATLVLEFPAARRQRADEREVVKRRELAISAIVGRDLRWEAR